ncbi:unnamed protein product, partial [Urochloa humidicola]
THPHTTPPVNHAGGRLFFPSSQRLPISLSLSFSVASCALTAYLLGLFLSPHPEAKVLFAAASPLLSSSTFAATRSSVSTRDSAARRWRSVPAEVRGAVAKVCGGHPLLMDPARTAPGNAPMVSRPHGSATGGVARGLPASLQLSIRGCSSLYYNHHVPKNGVVSIFSSRLPEALQWSSR